MNYLVDISYDGNNYHGWSKQENNISIQQTIEQALKRIYHKKITIIGSGRTDAKVHAIHQYFNFHEDKINLDPSKLMNAFTYQIPKDIKINKIKIVNKNFNARYNVKLKTYLYVINTGKFDLFKNNYLLNYNKQINVNLWKKAIKLFLGTHDFLSFSKSELTNTTRTITNIKITKSNDLLNVYITGNGFLRSMVRMIIGSLIDLNNMKKSITDIVNLINNPKKGSAITLANPCGLYLYKIVYKLN